jgi:hypothetical protein
MGVRHADICCIGRSGERIESGRLASGVGRWRIATCTEGGESKISMIKSKIKR